MKKKDKKRRKEWENSLSQEEKALKKEIEISDKRIEVTSIVKEVLEQQSKVIGSNELKNQQRNNLDYTIKGFILGFVCSSIVCAIIFI